MRRDLGALAIHKKDGDGGTIDGVSFMAFDPFDHGKPLLLTPQPVPKYLNERGFEPKYVAVDELRRTHPEWPAFRMRLAYGLTLTEVFARMPLPWLFERGGIGKHPSPSCPLMRLPWLASYMS